MRAPHLHERCRRSEGGSVHENSCFHKWQSVKISQLAHKSAPDTFWNGKTKAGFTDAAAFSFFLCFLFSRKRCGERGQFRPKVWTPVTWTGLESWSFWHWTPDLTISTYNLAWDLTVSTRDLSRLVIWQQKWLSPPNIWLWTWGQKLEICKTVTWFQNVLQLSVNTENVKTFWCFSQTRIVNHPSDYLFLLETETESVYTWQKLT